MRILYVATDQTLAQPHGGTVHVQSVVRELAQLGHEMHVVYQQSPQRPQLEGGCAAHTVRSTHRFLLWMLGPELERILEAVKPDVVMERYYNFAGEALFRAHRRGIPTVLEVNSPMIEYKGSLKSKADLLLLGRLKRRRERMAEKAALIIAPIRDIVPDPYRDKVREIEWGADTDHFDPAYYPDREILRLEKGFAGDDFLLVHFGSLRKWHGLAKLLEAFDSARPHFTRPVKLIIIGPCSPTPRPDVHFTGAIPYADMPSWLKMCDLAVFPFSPEQHRYLELGFYWSPLKVFEAMAMQLPSITLNHPRLKTILGTDEERFYYDGSQEDLARKIANLASPSEALQESFGAGLRQRALQLFSWKTHAQQLSDWISRLASPTGAPEP